MGKGRKSRTPKKNAQKASEEPIDPKEFVMSQPELSTEAPPPTPPDHPLFLTGAGESPDPNVTFLFTLWTRKGYLTLIGHALTRDFSALAAAGSVDAFIMATEDGFSPLGAAREFFETDLGIPQKEISQRANWNRFENERVTLLAFGSRQPGSHLKGIILAPGETSTCFRDFAGTDGLKRDFYRNVTYEAIAYASRMWGARRLAISHLSGCRNFHEAIAVANVEGLARFCEEASLPMIESFLFVGCCIEPHHLDPIKRLKLEAQPWTLRAAAAEALVHLSFEKR